MNHGGQGKELKRLALEGYTWRMLQSPGMFDMRGSGRYALAIESAIADGLIGCADVREHCVDLRSTCGLPDGSPMLGPVQDDALRSCLVGSSNGVKVPEDVWVCRLNWGYDERGASAPGAPDDAWQVNGLLLHTVGNLVAVPCDVVALGAKRCAGACGNPTGRIDVQLSAVYRWLMGKPEPDGPGRAVRSRFGYEDGMASDRGAEGGASRGALVRWICGPRPLGNVVDRQSRWDAFVSRNCLHEYMGPAEFGLFGPPVPYDDDPARRLAQVNARIVARCNRMRNVAMGRGLASAGIVRVFGE